MDNDRVPVTGSQCSSRADALKNKFYGAIRRCIDQSGWEWDSDNCKVMQSNDQVWDEMIRVSNTSCGVWAKRKLVGGRPSNSQA